MAADQLEHARYVQEWWKVAASIATPLMIAVLTYFVTSSLNERQSDLRAGEQILSLKQTGYASIGPKLNRIYIYVEDIGDYREYTPADIIKLKREADREFYSYLAFWSHATRSAYRAFMTAAFETYVGSGTNAKIRTISDEKRAAALIDTRPWTPAMAACLTEERDEEIGLQYNRLVNGFLNDISVRTLYIMPDAPEEPGGS